MCQPIGSCLSGYAQKRFGKKSCVVLACVPSIFGWMLLWYANSVTMLYWSTITMGMGLGFTDGPAYSYIGEICEPRLRGIMSCVINMACLIGVLSSYGLSYVFQWKTVAAVSALCPVMCLTLVTFVSFDCNFLFILSIVYYILFSLFSCIDTGKSDLVAVQRQKRKGHESHLLAERMGRSSRHCQRVPRTGILLQDVSRQIEDDKRFEKHVFIVFMDQESFGVQTTTVGHHLLYIHVDFMSDALSPLYR